MSTTPWWDTWEFTIGGSDSLVGKGMVPSIPGLVLVHKRFSDYSMGRIIHL
jgi:hypothetical protein